MSHESAESTIELRDDLGNVYSDGHSMGGKGSSGPDLTTNEMVLDHSGEYRFFSTLDPKAKEITITVKEMMWVTRSKNIIPTLPLKMEQIIPSNYKFSVLDGPWEFKIIL